MNHPFNKEDLGLSVDIESHNEDILFVYGQELDNALDNPVNRMRFLFPNVEYPEASVIDIKLRIMSTSVDITRAIDTDSLIAIWSARTGKSTLELDIMCNMMIDADFRLVTEMEVESDWLNIVKKQSTELTEKMQIREELYYEIDEDDFFMPEEY
jgi:hypothetical protein